MQPPANFLKPWIYLSKQRFQALLIVGFLLWSSLLIIETVNVQHSCTPMINGDRKLPDVCSPPPPRRCDTDPDCLVPPPRPKSALERFLEQHPAEAMIMVAAVGAGIAAIAGAPILVIVGVGIGIFGMATKALTLAKHTLPPM